MTKKLDVSRSHNYLKKAENSLRMARLGIKEEAFDNSVMSSVHAAINAFDALTTFYLGKRSSGQHTDVLALIKGILTPHESKALIRHYSSLLSLKNASEYQPDPMSLANANDALKWAERIINKVKIKLPE